MHAIQLGLMGYKRLYLVGLCFLVALLCYSYSTALERVSHWPLSTDFFKFRISSLEIVDGRSPYWPTPDLYSPGSRCHRNKDGRPKVDGPENTSLGSRYCLHPNLNPPVFSVFAIPFAFLSFESGWWTWSFFSLIAGICSSYILLSEICNERGLHRGIGRIMWHILSCMMLFSYYPTMVNFQFGQVTLFLMVMLILAWRYMRHGRDIHAGILLGLAISVKPFVGLFVVSLIVDGRWRVILAVTVICFALFVLGLFAVGLQGYIEYISAMKSVTWLSTSWNGSLSGLFFRIFGGAETPGYFLMPVFAKSLTLLSSLSVLVVMAGMVHRVNIRHKYDIKFRSDMLYTITTPSMLLISPLGWIYYFPLLLPVLFSVCIYGRRPSLANPVTLGVIVFLMLTIFPSGFYNTLEYSGVYDWFFLGERYSYALLLLFFVSLWMIMQAEPNRYSGELCSKVNMLGIV